MATVAQYARESLNKIQVQGAECPVEGSEFQDYLTALNDFMAQLEISNVCLGFTPVESPNDEVTIPAGLKMAVVNNMAIIVSPEYGGVISNELRELAISGMRVIRRTGSCQMRTRNPSTQPIGSGNEGWQSWQWHFYQGRMRRRNPDKN